MQNNFDQTFINTKPAITLSVIVPTYNDAPAIKKALDALARLVNIDEVVVVDGGSTDETIETVKSYTNLKKLKLIKINETTRGRRFHEGTKHAAGEAFWFLSADTQPVQGSGRQIKQYMRYRQVVGGNFEIAFAGASGRTRFLKKLYPYLRQIGLVDVDAAIFVRRETYDEMGGFRFLADFEELDFQKRLQKRGRFVHIDLPVVTAPRRIENGAFFRTFSRWSFFQTLYWLGVPVRLMAKLKKSAIGNQPSAVSKNNS